MAVIGWSKRLDPLISSVVLLRSSLRDDGGYGERRVGKREYLSNAERGFTAKDE